MVRVVVVLFEPFEPFAGFHLHYSCDSSRQQSRRARAQLLKHLAAIASAPDAAASARVLDELAAAQRARLDADEAADGRSAAAPREVAE